MKFTFTKQTVDEWNESNTVKYNGMSDWRISGT